MSPTPTRTPARPWSALLVAVLALPLLGVPPSTPATAAPAPLPEAAAPTLRVATYNIRCANCSLNSRINSREKNWETRRAKVVAQIKAEKVDVIGLQEASQGLLRGTKISQFDDLVHRLGAPYALTNDKRYGCVKSTSYKNCVKDDNGASGGVRIVYNTNRLTLLGQGSKQLDNEAATSGPRFVAWARFRDRASKREFFYATAHTEPGQTKAIWALRKQQAAKIAAAIRANNPRGLPVVLTGDFSSTKLTAVNSVYDVLMKSGLVVDPLGNTHRMRTTSRATAGKLINVRYNTLNGFKSKPTTHPGYALGAHLDYVFASRSVRVLEYKVVVDLTSSGRFSGVIPSDHNMVRATIRLS